MSHFAGFSPRSSAGFDVEKNCDEHQKILLNRLIDSVVSQLMPSPEEIPSFDQLRDNFECYTLRTQLGATRFRNWTVNVWYAHAQTPKAEETTTAHRDSVSSNTSSSTALSPIALFLHGHGRECCFASWIRFWPALFRAGFSLLAFDAPTFGQSSGPAGQANLWRVDDALLVDRLLVAFRNCDRSSPCMAFAQCMGGAMLLRTISSFPHHFGVGHVMSNCTIGAWPRNLESVLDSKLALSSMPSTSSSSSLASLRGGFLAFHELDADHRRDAVAYKQLSSLMHRRPDLCVFVDNENNRSAGLQLCLDATTVSCPGLTHGDDVFVFSPNDSTFQTIIQYALRCAVLSSTLFSVSSSSSSSNQFSLAQEQQRISAIECGIARDSCIQVYVRVRPRLDSEQDFECAVDVESGIRLPNGSVADAISVGQMSHLRCGNQYSAGNRFLFSRVFVEASSQQEVFDNAVAPLLDSVLSGQCASLLAYGQTGAGKTFTIFGTQDEPGMIAIFTRELFDRLVDLPNAQKCVQATFTQLYLENLYDLFDFSNNDPMPSVYKRDQKISNQHGLMKSFSDAHSLLQAINDGLQLRQQSPTCMNATSSRSHAILTLYITLFPNAQPTNMMIVDLAGSERVKKSGSVSVQFDEAVAINSSLFALANVVSALVENNGRPRAHIPYRDSKLTQLLAESVGGQCRTAVLVCVSPALGSASETESTLRFAATATFVRNQVADSQDADGDGDSKEEEMDDNVANETCAQKFACSVFLSGPASELIELPNSGRKLQVFGDFSAGPSAPCLVLLGYYLAGSPGGEVFLSWFSSLSQCGYRCLAPSFPGHGLSPGPALSASSDSADFAGTPCSILEEILQYYGLKQVSLLGWDWGGGLALEFALKCPRRVNDLFGWAVSYRDEARLVSLKKKRIGKSGDRRLALFWDKNDPVHSYKRGQKIAAVLGVKITDAKDDQVLGKLVEMLR